MINNSDDMLSWIEENDIIILDRGFCDSFCVLKSFGIDVPNPCFLGHNEKQLDFQQAYISRFIIMLRWKVESINTNISRFKWFCHAIPSRLSLAKSPVSRAKNASSPVNHLYFHR